MCKPVAILLAGVVFAGCATGARTAHDTSAQPSASVPSTDGSTSPVGVWRGTASEISSIYTGPASATVSLDVRPDGTYTQVWTERGQERVERGRWHARGNRVVFDGTDRKRMLRYSGDALYGVTTEGLPAEGRVGTEAVSLRRGS